MSNYAKLADYAIKDSLTTGDPDKVVKGEELDDEFNAISVAIATKADTASPSLTGTPTAPTAVLGTSSSQIATTAFVQNAVLNPVIESLIHEGTVDDFETTVDFTDPTADRTITFPDKDGTLAMTSELPSASTLSASSGTYSIAGSTTLTVTITAHNLVVDDVVYLNFTSGDAVDGYYTVVTVPTANTFTVTHGTSITSSGNVTGYYSNVGLIAIASTDETLVGTNTNRAVTPAGVAAVISASFVRGTSQASTSGTEINFTGIPSTVKRITVLFNEVSLSGNDRIVLQLGDAGGIETTGYTGNASDTANIALNSTFFNITATGNNAYIFSGSISLFNFNGNTWIESGLVSASSSVNTSTSGGSKTLSDVLTQLRITRSGTNTFDAGAINIMYE